MKSAAIVSGLLILLAFTGCVSPETPDDVISYSPTLMRPGPSTTVPLTNTASGLWLVRARVNGTPGLFAVDTGAAYTILTPQFVSKLGLPFTVQSMASHAPPTDRTPSVRITYLTLGDFDYLGFAAPVLNLDHISRALRVELDGIIGNNVLRKTTCTFDWRANILTLDAEAVTRPANAIPITIRTNRIYFTVLVNGQPAEFALDTGAYRSLISELEVERLKISKEKRSEVTAPRIDITEAREVRQTRVLTDTFKLGPIDRSDYSLLVWKHNVLGMDLLQSYILKIDAGNNWMSLATPGVSR